MRTFEITNDRKLVDEDVLVIRVAHLPGHPKYGTNGLASLFGVTPAVITNVVTRKTYKHLPMRQVPEGAVVRTKFAYEEAGKRARVGLEEHVAARARRLSNLRGIETRRARGLAKLSDEAADEYRKAIGYFEANKGLAPKEVKALLARLAVRVTEASKAIRDFEAEQEAYRAEQNAKFEREQERLARFEATEHGPTHRVFTEFLSTPEGLERRVELWMKRRRAEAETESI